MGGGEIPLEGNADWWTVLRRVLRWQQFWCTSRRKYAVPFELRGWLRDRRTTAERALSLFHWRGEGDRKWQHDRRIQRVREYRSRATQWVGFIYANSQLHSVGSYAHPRTNLISNVQVTLIGRQARVRSWKKHDWRWCWRTAA